MRWAAVVALMCACFLPTTKERTYPRGPAKIVAQHRIYHTYNAWDASPWSRPSDPYGITPVNLLVSEDNYGCVVEPGEWVMAQERVRFVCKTGWRAPRLR